ncbi:lipopolysaccharide biosynthesis protein [Curtobacterium sp. NPDC087082]|uniref:lipopolysaccharide biosynthesis protein n=1 Tax=Curtobacterium sp. NPDC087082 TaxID=3363966 RepID=UPI00381F370B
MPRTERHAVAFSTLGNAVAPIAALATAPVLAHALQAEGRGLVAAATAPLLLAVALGSLGLPAALNHWIARHPGITRPAFLLSAVISAAAGAGLTVVLALLGPTLAGGHETLGRLILLAALALVPNLLAALLQSVAAGHHAWRLIAIERLVTQGSRLAVIGGLALAGTLTVEFAVVAIAASPVLGACCYLGLLRGASNQTGSSAQSAQALDARVLVSYGGRVWFGALSGILLSRLDQTLMVPLAGAVALGLYAVAVNIADVPLIVANAVREVSFSDQSASNDPAALARSSRLTTAAVTLASISIGLAMPLAVPLLFGADFREAVPVAAILLLGLVLGSPGSLAGVGLAAAGRPGLRSVSLAVAAVCSAVALVLLAPVLGALGAALATCLGNVVSAGGNLVFLRRLTGQPVSAFFGLRRSDLRAVRALLSR